MRIIKNTSGYNTAKLKSLFCEVHSLVAKREGKLPHWKDLKVAVRRKSYGYSGRAYLGKVYGEGWDLFLSINDEMNISSLSQLFAHELYHSYGFDHNQYQSWPLSENDIKILESKFSIEDLISKEEEKTTQVNLVAKNYTKLLKRKENLLKRQKQYESNLKRITNNLKKVRRSLDVYEKKYDQDRLTTKEIAKTHRKKAIHPKQKCKDLCQQYSWLRIKKWHEIENRIYVYDYREEQKDIDFFADGISGDYCTYGWKEAYEKGLDLIEEKENETNN